MPPVSPIAFLRRLASDPQLRNADFRRFWFSSILTNFGAQITLLALPICAALLLHATPAQMGTLAAIGSLPFLLFGLPTGVLLDRSRRLPVMLCSDAMVALEPGQRAARLVAGLAQHPLDVRGRVHARHRLRGRRQRRADLPDLPGRARQA